MQIGIQVTRAPQNPPQFEWGYLHLPYRCDSPLGANGPGLRGMAGARMQFACDRPRVQPNACAIALACRCGAALEMYVSYDACGGGEFES